MGVRVYVHRDYQYVFGEELTAAVRSVPCDFDYTVVKHDRRLQAFSFVESPDFDAAPEPTVGRILTVLPDGTVRVREQRSDPEIYHHKWLFVEDDYSGFDVAASRRRTEAWMAIEGVDRSRIGRRGYWDRHVVPLIDSDDGDQPAVSR